MIQTPGGDGIIILEVDEHSHGLGNMKPDSALVPGATPPRCEDDSAYGYAVLCEQRRMMEVVAAMRTNGGNAYNLRFLRHVPSR